MNECGVEHTAERQHRAKMSDFESRTEWEVLPAYFLAQVAEARNGSQEQ